MEEEKKEKEEVKEEKKEKKEKVDKKKDKKKFKMPLFMKTTIAKVVIVVVLLLFVILGFKIGSGIIASEAVTKLGFRDVGVLVTQTCDVTEVEDVQDPVTFWGYSIPFVDSRQIFSYDFEVDAAVDFNKLKITRVSDLTMSIDVVMPKSKLYKTTPDYDSLKIYLDQGSIFTRIDLKENNDAMKRLIKKAEDSCLEKGLLEKADENAKTVVTAMIKGNPKYKNYRINFLVLED